MKIATIALAAAMVPAWAQEIKLPAEVEALAAKAEEVVSVTMDKSMLGFAGRFLHDKDDDTAEVRKLLAGLDGIYVRSFRFAEDGQYSAADVEAIRSQFQTAPWGRLVGVKSKHGDNVDIYCKDAGGGKLGGIVVIAAEPKELTIVNILGTLDPEKLAELGGEFGIPRLEKSGTLREVR